MKLKTISVHKTTIPQLNWLVAVCIGLKPNLFIFKTTGYLASEHNYATNWAQGGVILEREKISVGYERYGAQGGETWDAVKKSFDDTVLWLEYGPTPLIAAMRVFVASRLGNEVDVPEEI